MMNEAETELLSIADAIAAQCLAVRIRMLGRVVTAIYDRCLKKFDITTGQVTLLVFLARHAGVSPAAAGRALEMEKSTVSRNLGRMHKKGWIEISATPHASQALQLTASGRQQLLDIYSEWELAQSATSALLGDESIRALYKIFDLMNQKLQIPKKRLSEKRNSSSTHKKEQTYENSASSKSSH